MSDLVDERLHDLLRVVCEDALFVTSASGPHALDAFGERRAYEHEVVARDGRTSPALSDFEPWVLSRTRALVVDDVPWFVPMREVIDSGLTLGREPRGLRAVIPIGVEAERARIRRDATFAVRVVRVVAAADGELSAHETRAIELLIAALGLPEDDARIVRTEPAIPIAALELPTEIDPRTKRAIVAGAWEVAASDGVEDAEREAIHEVATRLGVEPAVIEELRTKVVEDCESQRAIGRALVDVVRYVLAPVPPEECAALAIAAAELAVPPIDRATVVRVVRTNANTPLGKAHDLDRTGRRRVLAAAWAAALATDPSASRRARLALRHDRAAEQLNAARLGGEARELVDDWVGRAMARAASTAA